MVHGHNGKARHNILIDTDAAIDDMRAISLMLASPDIKIHGITTVNGVLDSRSASQKVNALLRELGHEGILLAVGEDADTNIPPMREFASAVFWGNEVSLTKRKPAVELMFDVIQKSDRPLTVIALGPFTNLASLISKYPDCKKNIEKIIWFNEKDTLSGINYFYDKPSYSYMIESGIPIDIVQTGEGSTFSIHRSLLEKIAILPGKYARLISLSHTSAEVLEKMEQNHLKLWDDLLPVYLLYPHIFSKSGLNGHDHIKEITIEKYDLLEEKILKILGGEEASRSVLFKAFPALPQYFDQDVASLLPDYINSHGVEEWRLFVLTNEFHEHLGIYTMVGTKMGLRAREYFKAGLDELKVVSHAGSRPPVSCMNDGLQVSTGATLGHGSITIGPGESVQASAVFTYNGRSIQLSLLQSYREIIKRDIKEAREHHGANTLSYWTDVRRNGLNYWLQWKREHMFRITVPSENSTI